MKTQWILISTLVFALVTAVFAVINVEKVRVNFLFAETDLPLILVILGSTLLGGLIVGTFGIVRQFKLQRTIKQFEKQLLAWQNATGLSEPPSPETDDPQSAEASSASV
ncbi:LapA family protein [Paenibacillus hamazuiensis]|uniref:LapA family protein n=1 Tax=Paenibacillus hamazuiensis TaxID=2936508 RepID=UPI0020105F8C|nr:lipopolysaccharide assembly protein LapA domain-containing protein [Paenibacillus hamazuiensis]